MVDVCIQVGVVVGDSILAVGGGVGVATTSAFFSSFLFSSCFLVFLLVCGGIIYQIDDVKMKMQVSLCWC